LGLVTSLIGCGSGEEATSPEGREIERFLKDKHVNAVLWEEWKILDEYSLMDSLTEPQTLAEFSAHYKEWLAQRQVFRDRAAKNLVDIQSISPPASLNEFWTGITRAMNYFSLAIKGLLTGSALSDWEFHRSMELNAQAWLALSNICWQYNIKMEWPMPRTP